MTALEVGPLPPQTWPEAMRLCARAFVDYGYVHVLFGDDPIDRIAGTTAEYGHVAWNEDRISVGAWAGPTLVGTASVERLGRCQVCGPPDHDGDPGDEPDDERVAASAQRFNELRRREHAPVPPHGHVVMVAVEPVVQRGGIGGATVDVLLERFRADGGGPLLLECIVPLEPFYARYGFRTIGGFEERGSDDILVMRADL